jgi:hypothetical protein
MCCAKREFRESSLGESRALLRGVKELLPVISIFCDQFGKKSMLKIYAECHTVVVSFVKIDELKPVLSPRA